MSNNADVYTVLMQSATGRTLTVRIEALSEASATAQAVRATRREHGEGWRPIHSFIEA